MKIEFNDNAVIAILTICVFLVIILMIIGALIHG